MLKGVITHSSGNHGQALAWAAAKAGVPCVVVVPENAPQVKVDAIRSYGARLVACEPTMKARVSTCEKLAKEFKYVEVHPHNDLDVISGQVSAIAVWTAHRSPKTKVFCVVPKAKDQIEPSLRAGKPLWADTEPTLVETIADGIRPDRLGSNCWPHVLKHCQHDVLTVQVIETSSAIGVAALLNDQQRARLDVDRGSKVNRIGVILCGGNVDLNKLPWLPS